MTLSSFRHFQLLCLCCCSSTAFCSEVWRCTAQNLNADACLYGIAGDMNVDESGSDDEISALQTTLATVDLSSQEHLSLQLQNRNHQAVEDLKVSHAEPALLIGNTSVIDATNSNTGEVTHHAVDSEVNQRVQRISTDTGAFEAIPPEVPQQAELIQDVDVPQPPSMFTFWDIDYKISLGELCLVFLIIILRELGLARNWFGKQDFRPENRWYMKAAEILRIVVAAADYAFLIPLALNVSKVLGGDVVMSGFLISAFALGVGLGTLFSMRWLAFWSHETRRRALVLTLTFASVCEAVLSLLMTVPSLQRAGALTVVTLFVRVLCGFASGWGSTHLLMLGSVCTPQELNKFDQWTPVADFCGLLFGFGIVALALAMSKAIHPADYFAACSGPMLTIACLQMIAAACISFTVPLELDQVSCTNDDKSEERAVVEYAPDILGAEPADVITSKNREEIAVSCFFTVGVISLASVGIEAGTSYMMEQLYRWSPKSIALGMTVVFLSVVLIISLVSFFRVHWGTSIDRRLAIPLLILSICATVLYFPHLFSWEGEYHLFAGDLVVYPSVALVGGMLMGYAVWAANPDKWNYSANVVTTAQVTDSTVKFLGAPGVRVLIQLAGREAYAIMQVVLVSLVLLTFLWVKNVNMYVDKATLDEAVPSGRGFFQEMKNRKERFLKNFRPDDWTPDET